MKKLFVGLFLTLFAALAFAIPSPRQIEDALAAKDYVTAKSMISEVLREKPDSARAHLLKAFVLVHVDKNKSAAANELDTAAALDKKGDVKNSSLFGRTVAEIEALKVQAPPPAPKPVAAPVVRETVPVVQQSSPVVSTHVAAPVKHDSGPGFGTFLVILVIGVGVVVIVYLVVNRPREPQVIHTTSYVPYRESSNTTTARSSVARIAYEPDTYRDRVSPSLPAAPAPVINHYHTAPIQNGPAVNQGLGFGGTVAATAGGVLAGELIHDALTHKHHDSYEDERRRRRDDSYSSSGSSSWDSTPAYVPAPVVEETPAVSYSSSRSSYSSGSDDSWTSRDDSSSRYSSSSSSSSYDSGSSSWGSSSSDSGSSWDSGSSSSSSDW